MKYYFIFGLSYLGLLWERIWNRIWAAASVLLFFVALSLLNFPLLFGTIGHFLFLGLFALALVMAFSRTKEPFFLPTVGDVERHMERVSTLEHRPLEALNDTPAEGLSEESLKLWRKHLQRAARYIDQLKIYTPQTDVTRRDKAAFRHAAVILLVVGLVIAQEDAASRIYQVLTPDIGSFIDKKAATFDLWITPPEYTHDPAVFLATTARGVVAHESDVHVSAGSILKLRMTGYRFAPKLKYAGKDYPLPETAPDNFTLELPLQESGTLRLTSLFSRLGEWPIVVDADTAPTVSIVQTDPTPSSAVKITYKARDDHGLTKISGSITLPPDVAEKFNDKAYRFNIPVSSSEEASHVEDLTAHLWAGFPAIMTLEAEDNAGHKTISASHSFVLPERNFTNPVAKRLVQNRKNLSWAKDTLSRRAAAADIAEIVSQPELYKNNNVIFLSLTIATRRLIRDNNDTDVASVQGLLWDVALKLEDGGLSLAQRELRDALQKMSSALNDKNMSKQELQDILDEVQKKMQQYMQSLASEMQQRLQQGKNMPMLSPEMAKKFMKSIDLGQMLEQMRRLSQMDSRESLQKMVDSLRNTIDNIDMKKFDQMQEQQMKAMKALQNLQEIIHGQQQLYDKTNKSDDPENVKKSEQSALREKLGSSLRDLAEGMENIPENFAKADQGMKLSEDTLGKKLLKESLPHQKTVLDELQKGMDKTIEQMAQSMQQSMMSFGMMPNGGNYGQGYDPLGRNNGGMDDDDIKLPDEKEQRRVQKIIEELRNRSNEPNRTKVERDYIDRLLDQF